MFFHPMLQPQTKFWLAIGGAAALIGLLWLVQLSPKNPLSSAIDYQRPSRGSGSVIVDIYSDFTCSHCYTLASTVDQLAAQFPTQITVRWHFLPRTQAATAVALAAACAHEQDKFWIYHNWLFNRNGQATVTDLEQAAVDLSLNAATFHTCLIEQKPLAAITADVQDAFRKGITGTPAVYVNDMSVDWQQLTSIIERLVIAVP